MVRSGILRIHSFSILAYFGRGGDLEERGELKGISKCLPVLWGPSSHLHEWGWGAGIHNWEPRFGVSSNVKLHEVTGILPKSS